MKILLFGGKERGRVCLEAIIKAGHEIVGVVWAGDDVVSGQALKVFNEDNPDNLLSVPQFRNLGPEVTVLAGYPKLVDKEIIDQPSKMCINLHAGPLPRYRGPHPLNWMLINGETQGAFSIIEVDQGVDTGPILAQEWFPIGLYDTYKDLLRLSLETYPGMLLQVLQQIEEGTVKKRRQSPKDGFWCTRRRPGDGRIDWKEMTAEQVHNLVRALVSPMPGARAFCSRLDQGVFPERVIIEETRLIERTYFGVFGRVAAHLKSGVVIICKDRGILITKCSRFNFLGHEEGPLPATEVLPATGGDMVWTSNSLG